MSAVKNIIINEQGGITAFICDSSDRVIHVDEKIRVNAPWTRQGWYEREVPKKITKIIKTLREKVGKDKEYTRAAIAGGVTLGAAALGTGLIVKSALSNSGKNNE